MSCLTCYNCQKKNVSGSNYCGRCGKQLKCKTECPICLETKKTTILDCGHRVCIKCLTRLQHLKCPICRKIIHSVIKVFE